MVARAWLICYRHRDSHVTEKSLAIQRRSPTLGACAASTSRRSDRPRLAADFGFAIPVRVVPTEELTAVAAAIPSDWANDDAHKSDVIFLFPELHRPDALEEFPVVPQIDEAIYAFGAVLWRVSRQNQTRSGLQSLVGTPLYRRCTIRNVNTVRKLAALAAAR